MAAINIGEANAGDAYYRYKMPRLQARIEGRGNGIKTNVVNNVDIAKALERPPDYIVKYFGCELGAQTKYDKGSGTSIVNGAHDTSKLSELLEGFIKKYVQCYSCGNPETEIKLKKDSIYLKCKACGAISAVDMAHKLNTYITKNPPEVKVSKAEKRLKKQEKERLQEAAGENLDKEEKKKKKSAKDEKGKKKKKKGEDNSNGEDDEDGDEEEEIVWMTDTSEAAAARRAQEQLTSATAAMVTQGNIEAEQEEARKREEKERKRREAEEEAARKKAEEEARAARERAEAKAREEEAKRLADEAAKKLLVSEAEEDEKVAALRKLAVTNSPKDFALAVRKLQVEGGPVGRMRLVYEALFGEVEVKLGQAITSRKTHLTILAGDSTQQLTHLVALEHLLGVHMPGRVKEIVLALKALYDLDIVEDGLITAWHAKLDAARMLGVPPAAAKAVREAAKPFVEWLSAEDSDEEDDDEEDDEEEEED